jgi:hypothetical protein
MATARELRFRHRVQQLSSAGFRKSAAQLNAFNGTNFAVGGARTPDLALEITVYRNFFPTVDPDALYVFCLLDRRQ